jgi:hypothetical protein
VANLVMRYGPLSGMKLYRKIFGNFRDMGHTARFSYALWAISVLNRRRFGHVNVICGCSVHMCGQERGKKGAMWTEQCGLKIGQLALSMGPARAEVCSYVQRATILSKRVIPYCSELYEVGVVMSS